MGKIMSEIISKCSERALQIKTEVEKLNTKKLNAETAKDSQHKQRMNEAREKIKTLVGKN